MSSRIQSAAGYLQYYQLQSKMDHPSNAKYYQALQSITKYYQYQVLPNITKYNQLEVKGRSGP